MRAARVAVSRFLNELRAPSAAANLRRLQRSGEKVDTVMLRNAGLDDVSEVARVHVAAFRSAYAGRGPTESIRAAQWESKLRNASPETFCLVAEQEGRGLIGFAHCHEVDFRDYEGQLEKIYLLREYRRVGIGRRLMCAAAARFLHAEMKSMMLLSQAENPACHFFEALGGQRILNENGEFHGAFGWQDLTVLVDHCESRDGYSTR